MSIFLSSVLFPDELQQTIIEVVAGSQHSAALTGMFSYSYSIIPVMRVTFAAPQGAHNLAKYGESKYRTKRMNSLPLSPFVISYATLQGKPLPIWRT